MLEKEAKYLCLTNADVNIWGTNGWLTDGVREYTRSEEEQILGQHRINAGILFFFLMTRSHSLTANKLHSSVSD